MVMRTPEEALQQAEAAQRALLTALPAVVTRSPTITPTALPAAVSTADRSIAQVQNLGRDLVASLPMSPQFVQRLIGASLDANSERDFAPQVSALINFARHLEQHPNQEQEAFLRRVVQQFPSIVQTASSLSAAGFDAAGFRSAISRSLDPNSPNQQLFDNAVSLASFVIDHRSTIESDQAVKTAVVNTFSNLSRPNLDNNYLAAGLNTTRTAVSDFVQLRSSALSEEIEHQIGQIDDLLESVRNPHLARALTQMRERLESYNAILTSGRELDAQQILFVNCARSTINSITSLSTNNLLTPDLSPVLVRSLELSLTNQTDLSTALSTATTLIAASNLSASAKRSFLESLANPNVSLATIATSFGSLMGPNFPNSSLAPSFSTAVSNLSRNPTLDSVMRLEAIFDLGQRVPTLVRSLGRDQAAVEGFNAIVNRAVTIFSSNSSADLGSALVNLATLYVSADPQTRILISQFSSREGIAANDVATFNSLVRSRVVLSRLISHEPRSSPLYQTYQNLLSELNQIITDQAANRQADSQRISRVGSALSILFSPSAEIPATLLAQVEESRRGEFGFVGSLQNATDVISSAPAAVRRQLSDFYSRAINVILQNGLDSGLPLVLMAQAYGQNSADRVAIATDLTAANNVGTPVLANSASVYLDRARASQIRNGRDRALYLQITDLELSAARRGDRSGLDIFSNLASIFFNASATNNRSVLDSLRDGFVGTSGLRLPPLAQLIERYSQTQTSTLASIILTENPQFNYNENRRASFLPESIDPNIATSRIILIGPQEQAVSLLSNDLLAQNASLEGRRIGSNPITPTTNRAFAAVRRRLERLAASATDPSIRANYERQAALVDPSRVSERAASAARLSGQASEHFAASARLLRASITLSGPEYDAAVNECQRRYNRAPNDLVIGYLIDQARQEQMQGQMMAQAAVGLSSANQMSVNLIGASTTIPSPRGIFALERSALNFEQVAREAHQRTRFNTQFATLQAARMQIASNDYAYGSSTHVQAVAFNRARQVFERNATLVRADVDATVTSLSAAGQVMRDRSVERQADGSYRVVEVSGSVIDSQSLNAQIERARSLARSGRVQEAYRVLNRVRSLRRAAAVSGVIFTTNDRLVAGANQQERESGTMRGFDTVNMIRLRDQVRIDIAAGRVNQANQTLADLSDNLIPVSESAQVAYNMASARRQLAIAYRALGNQSSALAEGSRTTGVAADTNIDILTRNHYALARQNDDQALQLEELAGRTVTTADIVPRGTVNRILGTLEGAGSGQSLAGVAAYEQQMDELSAAIGQGGEAGGMRYLMAHPSLLERGLRLMRENGDLSQNASDHISAQVEYNTALVQMQQMQRVQGFVSTVFSTEVQMLSDIDGLGRSRRAAPIEREAYRTNATSFGHLAADAIANPAEFERRIQSGEIPTQFNRLLGQHLDTQESTTLGQEADRQTGIPINREEARAVAATHTRLTFASLGYATNSEHGSYHRIYLDQERQRHLQRALEISQRNLGQFAMVATTLSPGLSPTRLSLAGNFSREDAVSAYQNISASSVELSRSLEIISAGTTNALEPAPLLSGSQQSSLDSRAITARGRLFDSGQAVEAGASTERNVTRVGTVVEIAGAGLLSATGFGAPVAFYFLTQSSVGFLDQAVAAGGVENMSNLQLAVGGLGIGLALLGLGANGLGTIATELNAEIQGATALGMNATRLSTTLLGVNRASLLLGRSMMVGGALVGLGSAYEMHLHDPNAGLFDYGLTFFNAAQPGLLHGFQLAGQARPNLILGNSFGARAYRLGMMTFFGTGRSQMIEQYNARLSTQIARATESLPPEQQATYRAALGAMGEMPSLQAQRELLDFVRANPDHPSLRDPNQLAALARSYHAAGERAIYGLNADAHTRIHEVELELGRELSPGERMHLATQMPREGAIPSVTALVGELQGSQATIPGVDSFIATQRAAYEQARTQMAGAVTEGGLRTAPTVASEEAVNAAALAQVILANHNSTPSISPGSRPSNQEIGAMCTSLGMPELAPVVNIILADTTFRGASTGNPARSQQLTIAQWATDFYNSPIPGIELSANDRARIVHAVIAASAQVSGPNDVANILINLGHSPYEPGFVDLVRRTAQVAADQNFRSAPTSERVGLMYAHLQGEGIVVAERITGAAVRSEAPRVGGRLDRLRRLAAERAIEGQTPANDNAINPSPQPPSGSSVHTVASLGLTSSRSLTTFIRDVSLGNPTATANLASLPTEVQQAVREFIANPLFRSPRNRNSAAGRAAIARLAETIERLTSPREPEPVAQPQRLAAGAEGQSVNVVGGRVEVAPPLRAVPNPEAPVAMDGTPNLRPARRGPAPVPLDEGTTPVRRPTVGLSQRPASQRPRLDVTGGPEVFANALGRRSDGGTNRAASPRTSEVTAGEVQTNERPAAVRVNAPIPNDTEHIVRVNQLLDNPEAATRMRALQDESNAIADPPQRLEFVNSPEFRARAVAALGSEAAANSFVDLMVRSYTSRGFYEPFYYLLRETNPLLRSRLLDSMLNYEQTRGNVVGPAPNVNETQARLDRYSTAYSAAYRTSLSTDGATTVANAAVGWGLDPAPIAEAARDVNINALRTEIRDQLQSVRTDAVAAAGNGRNTDLQTGLARLPEAARAHLIGEYNRAGVEEVARVANLNEGAKTELRNAMLNLNGASFDDLIPVLQRQGISDPAQIDTLRRTYIGAGSAGMLRAVDGIVETICNAYELTGLTSFLHSQGIAFTPPTMMPERALTATRALADLVAVGNLAGNIHNIPGFENATITGARYRHGLRGAFAIDTTVPQADGSVRQRRLYLKMEDLAAARFGEQLLRAEGILTSNHYTGLSYETGRTCINGRPEVVQYGLIEDIHDLIGTQQTIRLPDGRIETVTVRSVGLVNDEITGPVGHIVGDPSHQAHEVTRQFYTQLGTEDGRVAIFDAWASYHQGSRNALLMDRAARNSVAAVVELPDGTRQLVFGAIDTDAITERIEPVMNNGAHAGNDLTVFNRDFTNVTNELVRFLPHHVSNYNANVPADQRITVTEFDIARSASSVAERPAPPTTYTREMLAARAGTIHDYSGGSIGFAGEGSHGVISADDGFAPRPRRQDGRTEMHEDEFHALHGQMASAEGQAAYQRARVDGADFGQFSALLRSLRSDFPQVHDNFVAVVNYLYADQATHRIGYGTNHRQDSYNNLGYLLAEGRHIRPELIAQMITNTTPHLVSAGVMTSEQAAAMQPTYQNLIRVVVERAVSQGSLTREQADHFFNTARQLAMRTGLDMFDTTVRGQPTAVAPPVVNISTPVDTNATTPSAVRGTTTTPAQDPNAPVAAPRVNVPPRVLEPTTLQDRTLPNSPPGQTRPVSAPPVRESSEPTTAPNRRNTPTPIATEEQTRIDIPLPPSDETTPSGPRAQVRTTVVEPVVDEPTTRINIPIPPARPETVAPPRPEVRAPQPETPSIIVDPSVTATGPDLFAVEMQHTQDTRALVQSLEQAHRTGTPLNEAQTVAVELARATANALGRAPTVADLEYGAALVVSARSFVLGMRSVRNQSGPAGVSESYRMFAALANQPGGEALQVAAVRVAQTAPDLIGDRGQIVMALNDIHHLSGSSGASLSRELGIPQADLVNAFVNGRQNGRTLLLGLLSRRVEGLAGISGTYQNRFIDLVLSGDVLGSLASYDHEFATRPNRNISLSAHFDSLLGAFGVTYTNRAGESRTVFVKPVSQQAEAAGGDYANASGAIVPRVVAAAPNGAQFVYTDGLSFEPRTYGFSHHINEVRNIRAAGMDLAVRPVEVSSVRDLSPESRIMAIFNSHPDVFIESFWHYMIGSFAAGVADRHGGNVWPMLLEVTTPLSPAQRRTLENSGYRFVPDPQNPSRELLLRFGGIDNDVGGVYSAQSDGRRSFSFADAHNRWGDSLYSFTDALTTAQLRYMRAHGNRALLRPEAVLGQLFGAADRRSGVGAAVGRARGATPFTRALDNWMTEFGANTEYRQRMHALFRAHDGQSAGMGSHVDFEGNLRELNQYGVTYSDYGSALGEPAMPIYGVDGRTRMVASAESAQIPNQSLNTVSWLFEGGQIQRGQDFVLVERRSLPASISLPASSIRRSPSGSEFYAVPAESQSAAALNSANVPLSRFRVDITRDPTHADNFFDGVVLRASDGFGEQTGIRTNSVGAIPIFDYLLGGRMRNSRMHGMFRDIVHFADQAIARGRQ
ncbi:MAG: hypothetical protein ACP5N9_06610 [Candidatus Bilamarchaeum sp.]